MDNFQKPQGPLSFDEFKHLTKGKTLGKDGYVNFHAGTFETFKVEFLKSLESSINEINDMWGFFATQELHMNVLGLICPIKGPEVVDHFKDILHKSKDNFYGPREGKLEIEFIPCDDKYTQTKLYEKMVDINKGEYIFKGDDLTALSKIKTLNEVPFIKKLYLYGSNHNAKLIFRELRSKHFTTIYHIDEFKTNRLTELCFDAEFKGEVGTYLDQIKYLLDYNLGGIVATHQKDRMILKLLSKDEVDISSVEDLKAVIGSIPSINNKILRLFGSLLESYRRDPRQTSKHELNQLARKVVLGAIERTSQFKLVQSKLTFDLYRVGDSEMFYLELGPVILGIADMKDIKALVHRLYYDWTVRMPAVSMRTKCFDENDKPFSEVNSCLPLLRPFSQGELFIHPSSFKKREDVEEHLSTAVKVYDVKSIVTYSYKDDHEEAGTLCHLLDKGCMCKHMSSASATIREEILQLKELK